MTRKLPLRLCKSICYRKYNTNDTFTSLMETRKNNIFKNEFKRIENLSCVCIFYLRFTNINKRHNLLIITSISYISLNVSNY